MAASVDSGWMPEAYMDESVPPPLITAQVACVEREIALRERVYPRQVAAGRMTLEKADRELAAMRGVLETLLNDAADAEAILICAVRYCIGRMTCVVGECDCWLRRRWPALSQNTRALILRDIRKALERDGRGHAEIGMDEDRRIWAALYRDFGPTP